MQLESAHSQLPLLPHSLYSKMVARGVDMSWYARRKKLSCSFSDIRILKTDGSLWTVMADIDEYGQLLFLPDRMAKPGVREYATQAFVCTVCGVQAEDYFSCLNH